MSEVSARPPSSPRSRLATRLSFLAAGVGYAAWAPLVPYAKARLQVDEGTLGLLLLCLGAGSVLAMSLTGALGARLGPRPVVLAAGLVMAAALPLLAVAPTPLLLGLALFIFGGAVGSLDVAMNIHAVEVEKAAGRPLMSGFHGLFSIGAFAGAGLVTLLLSNGLSPLASSLPAAAVAGAAVAIAGRFMIRVRADDGAPLFAVPRGVVLLLALLAALTFLVEGAILDWSALLMVDAGLARVEHGGLGFMVFSLTMTVGRLTGDRLTSWLGDRRTLLWGGGAAVAGLAGLLLAPGLPTAVAGFAVLGLGAANLAPVLFRLAGSQSVMPAALAIAAVTTAGYAGVLAGPAAVGFVADAVGLPMAFWMLAGLLALVPLSARAATAGARAPR